MPPYRCEPLDASRHQLTIRSGEPDLDGWLRDHAAGAQARRVSRTFVWLDDGERVVAYYSLAGHVLVRDGLPRSVGHGSPSSIPAILLARLALDVSLQGQGLGGAVLAEALGRAVEATHLVAARLVVVDALHERAAAFYEHHGFTRIPSTLRLVQKVSAIEAALH
jgi:GNAT superfamily N-acetyltransferase